MKILSERINDCFSNSKTKILKHGIITKLFNIN